MSKRRILRRFSINEISGVTAPAQKWARVAIMKRDAPAEDDAEGKAGFDVNSATGEIRTRLRLAYENARRSYPSLTDASNLGFAWRSLSESERNAILEEDVGDEDPTFDHEKVDVAKLADFLLECRAIAIGKAQPSLTREQTMAAAIDEKPELFKLAREAKRADLNTGNTEDAAAVTKRLFALQLLTAKAHEIRKAQPTLSLQAARIEARKRWPEIAARERA
jgi:hypothetical protein